jgi:transcriptional regulator with XRE-family HTH domain
MRVRLQAVRQEKRITRAELARRAKVSPSFIHSIEVGQKSPTLRTLEKLAAALDVPVTMLIEDTASAQRRR